MRRALITVLVFWVAMPLVAHNSRITTINLSVIDGGWVMHFAFAQKSLDTEILKVYSIEEIKEMDEKVLKKWFSDYVRNNARITSNGEEVSFGAGGISLGSHQTDLKFTLPDMPIFPERMSFDMGICEHDDHTNLLRIFQGDKMTKFFLNSENDFKVDLSFEDHEILESGQEGSEKKASLGWLGLILLLPLGFLIYKRVNPKSGASQS